MNPEQCLLWLKGKGTKIMKKRKLVKYTVEDQQVLAYSEKQAIKLFKSDIYSVDSHPGIIKNACPNCDAQLYSWEDQDVCYSCGHTFPYTL